MDLERTCICLPDDLPTVDFSSSVSESDLDEIDANELVEDPCVPHNIIWQEICTEFNEKRKKAADFIKSKEIHCEVPLNFALRLFEEHLQELIREALVVALNKAIDSDCIRYKQHTFNVVDYLSEFLWNKNPKHLERSDTWTYIFDINWVIEHLEEKPRPYYPLSWIWTPNFAATKIQSWVRGHWIRRREDVQEMRQFWIIIRKENLSTESKAESLDNQTM